MTRALLLPPLVLLVALCVLAPAAHAQAPDSSELRATESLIGQQHTLRLEVVAPPSARVEVDPGSPSWNGVTVVSARELGAVPEGDSMRHTLELVVAPFLPGQQSFAPAVNIIDGVDVQPRTLPPVAWEVRPTLPADAPLTLSPLPEPVAIAGAGASFVGPAIALGVVVGIILLSLIGWLIWRRLRRPKPQLPVLEPVPPLTLLGAEQLLDHDPVAAYRLLAATVRWHVGERYGLPAHALTARELQQRMEVHGIDRWQARLVGGLLRECESVVFAGYVPAHERRHGDLTLAREIVGGD